MHRNMQDMVRGEEGDYRDDIYYLVPLEPPQRRILRSTRQLINIPRCAQKAPAS